MFGLKPQELLALTVLAAVVTAAGNLLATVLKDFFFTRSFEQWKERRTLMSVYRKYRDPIVLGGRNLSPDCPRSASPIPQIIFGRMS